MPVYVYKNLNTGERFEVEQRITEPAWTEHPETGDPVKRLIQPVGIAFKGSGFYVTDQRSASNGASKTGANGGGDGGGANGGGGGESSSKPASDTSTSSSAPSGGTGD